MDISCIGISQSSIQKNIPRRIFVKGLVGATLVMSGIGCAPFSSPSPPLGKVLVTYHGHQGYDDPWGDIAIAWSPDSTRIASSAGRGIHIWNAGDGSHILTYQLPMGRLAWSPNGRQIVSAQVTVIAIWDTTTGKNVLVYQVLSEDIQNDVPVVEDVAWSPDGKHIVTGGYISSGNNYSQMQIWDAITGKILLRSTTDSFTPTRGFFRVLWSPDGTMIAAMGDDIEVLDASTASHIVTFDTRKLDERAIGPSTVAWSPDSKYIASAAYEKYGNSSVYIWDAISGKIVSTFIELGDVWSLAWSPDGKHIAIACAIGVQILDAKTGKSTYTYHSQFFISLLAWSPDGTRIASSGEDRDNHIFAVEVWQAA